MEKRAASRTALALIPWLAGLGLLLGASAPLAVSAGDSETEPAKTIVPGLGWTDGFTAEDLEAALAAGDREEVERILRLRSSHAPGTPNRLIGRALRAEQDGDAEDNVNPGVTGQRTDTNSSAHNEADCRCGNKSLWFRSVSRSFFPGQLKRQ